MVEGVPSAACLLPLLAPLPFLGVWIHAVQLELRLLDGFTWGLYCVLLEVPGQPLVHKHKGGTAAV